MGSTFDSFDASPLGARVQSAVDASAFGGTAAIGALLIGGTFATINGTSIADGLALLDLANETYAEISLIGGPAAQVATNNGDEVYIGSRDRATSPCVNVLDGPSDTTAGIVFGSSGTAPTTECNGLAVYDDRLWVVGRLRWDATITTYQGIGVQALDLTTDAWTDHTESADGAPYYGAACVVAHGLLWVLGCNASLYGGGGGAVGLWTYNGSTWTQESTNHFWLTMEPNQFGFVYTAQRHALRAYNGALYTGGIVDPAWPDNTHARPRSGLAHALVVGDGQDTAYALTDGPPWYTAAINASTAGDVTLNTSGGQTNVGPNAHDLALASGQLYAGSENVTTWDGHAVNNIARYDGSDWNTIGASGTGNASDAVYLVHPLPASYTPT